MQDIPAADYQVSVLEVASSSAGPDVVAKMEGRWKQKLLSRKFGLNANWSMRDLTSDGCASFVWSVIRPGGSATATI